MEIKTYWTEDKTKPIEFMVEAKFSAREKDMAIKVINNALWIANPLNDARPAGED